MGIRTATFGVTALIALLAPPAPLLAQDATALLQELQKTIAKEMPQTVRLSAAGSGYKVGNGDARVHYRIEPHTVQIDRPAADAIWRTPLGFLAAATAGQASVTSETLFGTKYQVITVTGPNQQTVRGYVTEKNVLERIRTERRDGAATVRLETVFFDWRDFNGVRFPSLIIEKENDEVSRILVVTEMAKDTKNAPS